MQTVINRRINMQYLSLKTLSESVEKTIDLQQLKMYLRIDGDIEDKLLQGIVQYVIDKFEKYTSQLLINKVLRVKYENFNEKKIILPIGPAKHINKIWISNDNDKKHTIGKSRYNLDQDSNTVILNIQHVSKNFIYRICCRNQSAFLTIYL